MASVVYNVFLPGLVSAAYSGMGARTTVGVMLVTNSYVPNVDTHVFRSDVTNEVVGQGYTKRTSLTTEVQISPINNKTILVLPGATWLNSSITARGAVYFMASSLIAYIDFGLDVVSTNSTFTLDRSEIILSSGPTSGPVPPPGPPSQPLDSDLTAIADLTTTTHGRSLLTGADAAATRGQIGLSNALVSSTVGIPGADQVTNIVSLTQAEYDAILPNASTYYIIT